MEGVGEMFDCGVEVYWLLAYWFMYCWYWWAWLMLAPIPCMVLYPAAAAENSRDLSAAAAMSKGD